MKKIIALALTLVLVLSMSVTVFAADTDYLGDYKGNTNIEDTNPDDNDWNTDAHNISITLSGTENVDKVYYVVVNWQTLSFTYTFKTDLTWDPIDHAYEDVDGNAVATPGSWDATTKTITVTNHSNDNVTVKAKANDADANDGVAIAATVATAELVSAVGTEFEKAPKTDVTVSISGTPADLDVTTAGTVVITIEHTV